MSITLVAALQAEERAIAAELRASVLFQRMDGIHRLLALYGAQPSVVLTFGEASQGADDRPSASVVPIATPSSSAAPVASAPAIPLPGPVAAVAEAAVSEVARPQPAAAKAPFTDAMAEPASVVSSVRAALLGIGKP